MISIKKTSKTKGKTTGRQTKLPIGQNSLKNTKPSPFGEMIEPVAKPKPVKKISSSVSAVVAKKTGPVVIDESTEDCATEVKRIFDTSLSDDDFQPPAKVSKVSTIKTKGKTAEKSKQTKLTKSVKKTPDQASPVVEGDSDIKVKKKKVKRVFDDTISDEEDIVISSDSDDYQPPIKVKLVYKSAPSNYNNHYHVHALAAILGINFNVLYFGAYRRLQNPNHQDLHHQKQKKRNCLTQMMRVSQKPQSL